MTPPRGPRVKVQRSRVLKGTIIHPERDTCLHTLLLWPFRLLWSMLPTLHVHGAAGSGGVGGFPNSPKTCDFTLSCGSISCPGSRPLPAYSTRCYGDEYGLRR